MSSDRVKNRPMLESKHIKQEQSNALKLILASSVLAVGGIVLSRFIPTIRPGGHSAGSWIDFTSWVSIVAAVVGLALASVACLLIGAVRWALAGSVLQYAHQAATNRQEVNRLLRLINDRLLVSDVTKRIAYRDRDRETLRAAIHEDIARGELESANMLVKLMDQLYGYHAEAEEFRLEVEEARSSENNATTAQAIRKLDEMLARHEWDKANQEAAKIQQRFPNSPQTQGLNQRVVHARENHKRSLERNFLEAAQRDDIDLAVKLLRELDRYLTEAEAEPFRETARGVIGKQRDNLGVQFKLAVHDKEWAVAVRVGEQIIREFPNTKMADEVRGMLDLLRQRAAEKRAAHA